MIFQIFVQDTLQFSLQLKCSDNSNSISFVSTWFLDIISYIATVLQESQRHHEDEGKRKTTHTVHADVLVEVIRLANDQGK